MIEIQVDKISTETDILSTMRLVEISQRNYSSLDLTIALDTGYTYQKPLLELVCVRWGCLEITEHESD